MSEDSSNMAEQNQRGQVQWNADEMDTGFSNVVNIQGTREQIELFFGTYRNFTFVDAGAVSVDLTHRMILTPLAAKRLNTILTGVLNEYEARHGVLRGEDGI